MNEINEAKKLAEEIFAKLAEAQRIADAKLAEAQRLADAKLAELKAITEDKVAEDAKIAAIEALAAISKAARAKLMEEKRIFNG